MSRMGDERGGVPALAALVLGGLVLALVLVVVSTEVRVRMARAQWAADGSARAAAVDLVPGRPGGGSTARRSAAEVAGANGARLVSIEVVDPPAVGPEAGTTRSLVISPTVVVTVELDGIEARAAAARFAVEHP